MRVNLGDVTITTPDKPRHTWGDFDAKDKNSDRVTLTHEPSRVDVTLNARDFGQHTLSLGIADLVSEIARKTNRDE